MRYAAKTEPGGREAAALKEPLEAILRGLGLELIELTVVRQNARKTRIKRGGGQKPHGAVPAKAALNHNGPDDPAAGGAAGTVQIRVIVYNGGGVGIDECSRAHHAILPRLELAFPGQDLYVEVSSPGIDRLIRDGVEAAHYTGRGIRCYRADISDWSAGILEAVDETGLILKGTEGTMHLDYDIIAKAKLYAMAYTDALQEG